MLVPQLKRFFESKRVPTVAVLVACLLSLPALRTGLVADDLWHRAMLQGGRIGIPSGSGPLSLFTFASGTAEEHARVLESGFLPWWASETLRLAFFRPVASLSHALDYALWPSWPALMHAHSIAWFAIVLILASRLYRRWLGPISPLAAGIATVFFALDHTHGLPVGWIANRNALLSMAFALGALLVHDSGAREARSRSGTFTMLAPFVTALLLALALGSGESAVSTFFYLGAHAVFLDERPVRARLASLNPSLVVAVGWAALYRMGRFGAVGSGVYHHPLQAPGAFLSDVVTHAPLLLGAELGAANPDPWPFLPLAAKAAFLSLAAIVIACAGSVFTRLARSDDDRIRRVTRFFVCAGYLSVIPGSATFPSVRTLFFASFALVGLLGLVSAGTIDHAAWARGATGRTSGLVRAFAGLSWLGKVVVAPLFFLLNMHSMAIFDGIIRKLAVGVPADASATDKRLVLVNSPDTSFAYYLLITHLEDGRRPPERMLVTTGNRRDVIVTRTAERVLRVHEDEGFYRTGTELLFRDVRSPMPVGSRIVLSDVTITVTHTTGDGVPDEATFELGKDPAEGYVFRAWKGMSLVPFDLPPVGESVTFPGRIPDLL